MQGESEMAVVFLLPCVGKAKQPSSCLTCSLVLPQELLFSSIQEGRYEFPEPEWSDISDEAKDLIQHLLVKEASLRLGADSVLEHPWMRYLTAPACRRTLVTPHNIRRNNSARELSAFAESAMAVNRVFQQHFSMNIDLVPKHTVETANLSNNCNHGELRLGLSRSFYEFKAAGPVKSCR